MFDSIKKIFTKTFKPPKEKTTQVSKKTQKKEEQNISTSSFEPSYIEPSSESVIKKTQRALKYRR